MEVIKKLISNDYLFTGILFVIGLVVLFIELFF